MSLFDDSIAAMDDETFLLIRLRSFDVARCTKKPTIPLAIGFLVAPAFCSQVRPDAICSPTLAPAAIELRSEVS